MPLILRLFIFLPQVLGIVEVGNDVEFIVYGFPCHAEGEKCMPGRLDVEGMEHFAFFGVHDENMAIPAGAYQRAVRVIRVGAQSDVGLGKIPIKGTGGNPLLEMQVVVVERTGMVLAFGNNHPVCGNIIDTREIPAEFETVLNFLLQFEVGQRVCVYVGPVPEK